MTKGIILTAFTVLLGTISGQAFAHTSASPKASHEFASRQKASNAFDVFDQTMGQRLTMADAHRYHGGPKSND